MNKNIDVCFIKDGARLSKEAFLVTATVEYEKACASMDKDMEAIGAAVKAAFDARKGARLNQAFIKTQVAIALGVTPETMAIVDERTLAYLKENTGEQGDGKLFASQKGRNGGTWRQADYVAPVEGSDKTEK